GVSSFFVQAEDGIRDFHVTGVQTCALPIFAHMEELQAGTGVTQGKARELEAVADLPVDPLTLFDREIGAGCQDLRDDAVRAVTRSEERRVGKEGRTRGWAQRE